MSQKCHTDYITRNGFSQQFLNLADKGIFSLLLFLYLFIYPLRRQRRHRLAAARSRSGSERPPDVHSLPSRRFATLLQGEAWIISADFMIES